MKQNVGDIDRYARIVLGLVLLLIGLYTQTLIWVLGIPLIISGIMRFCFLYTILGISTCPVEKPSKQ